MDTGEIIILIPVFNDWSPLQTLLHELDAVLKADHLRASVLVIDDASTQDTPADFAAAPLTAIDRIDVLHLRRNLSHQRAIAVGLAYVAENRPGATLVVMDGDGEDQPADVPRLLKKVLEEQGRKIIFAERRRRSESLMFQAFYHTYRWLHKALTGLSVRVGNFSAVPPARVQQLAIVSEMWNHYAAAVIKARVPYDSIPTNRGKRYGGRSHMNFVSLVLHGLSALSVYADIVGVRLLVAVTVLIGLAAAGGGAAIILRLVSPEALPAWVGPLGTFLLIALLQAVMLSFLLIFMILSGRASASFIPLRDYKYFVAQVETLRPQK